MQRILLFAYRGLVYLDGGKYIQPLFINTYMYMYFILALSCNSYCQSRQENSQFPIKTWNQPSRAKYWDLWLLGGSGT